ncbi:DHH family phosphoesterase [Aquimarina agarilytica]|uniref:DHH family phosphoesterase n=1 Tax=Aquimarina agarilytica TaxID=1087449 RepID=UPI000289FCA0
MKMKNITELKAAMALAQNIVIIPHKNPDGDAMGSTLALHSYLVKKQKNATVITPNDYPSFLKWLPYNDDVVVYENNNQQAKKLISNADLIFTLDFNHLGRCGDLQEPLIANTKADFVMIDHHQQPDDYATYMYSDSSMCSTCEMVYHFIEQMGDLELLTKEIATCLYTGIMTDTGSFRYRSTTSTTHRVIAHLIDAGANNTQIHEQIYDTNTFSKLQLKGVALKNLRLFPEYRTAYISLSQKELNDHNFKKGDTEGFVNIGLSIDNIIFAVIFIENENEEIIKMSFRSKGDFSVNQFARNHFEGGGHDNAAGGKSDLNMSETIEKFMTILPQYKKELLDS